MKFKDAKVGEVINVWLRKDNKHLTVDSDGGRSRLVQALVLQKLTYDDAIIGWKAGQEMTQEPGAEKLYPQWERYGIVSAHRYGNHCHCEATMDTSGKELCLQCGELHDAI